MNNSSLIYSLPAFPAVVCLSFANLSQKQALASRRCRPFLFGTPLLLVGLYQRGSQIVFIHIEFPLYPFMLGMVTLHLLGNLKFLKVFPRGPKGVLGGYLTSVAIIKQCFRPWLDILKLTRMIMLYKY